MTSKEMKIVSLSLAMFFMQALSPVLATQETLSAEEFITRLRVSGDIGIFDSPSVSIFNSTCATVAPPVEVQEGSEYIVSVRLYLVNEYDQAYEEASSPFRSLKAAQALAGSVFDMLLSSIQDFLYTQYQEFGCMNFEARVQGRIFDNVAPSDLPPGNYTYVITETGDISYGLVTDGLEFGVKHLHIAQGRRIAVAGEVRIGPNRELTYNELSGTFTNQAINQAQRAGTTGYQNSLLRLARDFFNTDPNAAGVTRTERTLFPEPHNNQPTANDIRQMCAHLQRTAQIASDQRYDQLRSIEVCQ